MTTPSVNICGSMTGNVGQPLKDDVQVNVELTSTATGEVRLTIVSESDWTQSCRIAVSKHEEKSGDPTVLKVPAFFKKMSPEIFEPKNLRLGLHNRVLKDSGTSEPYKMDIARELTKAGMTWNTFASQVVQDSASMREEYEALASDEFLGLTDIRFLLALDALFLVVYFQHKARRYATGGFSTLFENLVFQRQLPRSMKSDLALVENQIPMKLLLQVTKQLCELEGKNDAEKALDVMLKESVFFLYPFDHGTKQEFLNHLNSKYPLGINSLQDCDHILDCVYRVVCNFDVNLPSYNPSPISIDVMAKIPSATKLRQMGIRVEGTARIMSDIEFIPGGIKSARVRLPKLKMFDHTQAYFRNLAVYEQLANPEQSVVRSYLQFMSYLIETEEDVELLGSHRVLKSMVGNGSQAIALWSKMGMGLVLAKPEDRWFDLHDGISQHLKHRLKGLRRQCHERFFIKPWLTIGWVVATLILIFTFIQAYTGVVNANSMKWHFNW